MKENNYFEGSYRKNSKGFGFVKCDELEEEVYISKENSKGALDGDYVLIKILELEDNKKSKEGKIIKILIKSS